MAHPKAQLCPCCGYAAVNSSARPGRVVRYRNAALTLPAELRLPACRRCKYEPLGLDTLPPHLLESLYRDSLRQRVALAIARIQGCRSQRRTELLLNLSQGYLSRLKAGDGIPGAALVSLLGLSQGYLSRLLADAGNPSPPLVLLLAQLAKDPESRLPEIERFWREIHPLHDLQRTPTHIDRSKRSREPG